jgi:hypothetical protein
MRNARGSSDPIYIPSVFRRTSRARLTIPSVVSKHGAPMLDTFILLNTLEYNTLLKDKTLLRQTNTRLASDVES